MDGDDRAEAERLGAFDEVCQDHRADAATLMVGVDVDRILDGEAVAVLAAERVERAIADDVGRRLETGDWRVEGARKLDSASSV